MLLRGQQRRLPPILEPGQRPRKEREREQRMKQGLRQSQQTLPKLKYLKSKMEKIKIIKELMKKYLFESFREESYGYHRTECCDEKHSR